MFENNSTLEQRLHFLSELVEKSAEKMDIDLTDGISTPFICPIGCTCQIVKSRTYVPQCPDCGRSMVPPIKRSARMAERSAEEVKDTPKSRAQFDQSRSNLPRAEGPSEDEVVRAIQAERQAIQMQIARHGAPDAREMERCSAMKCQLVGELLQEIGHTREAERWSLAAVKKAETEGNLEFQCAATVILGRLRRNRGEFGEALSLYRQALALAERLGDERREGLTCDQIGSVFLAQGQVAAAIDFFKKGLEIAQRTGDEGSQAVGYGNLGLAYLKTGDLREAVESQQKSIALYLRTGNQQGLAKAYGNLGAVFHEARMGNEAVEMYSRSLKINEKLGLEAGMAINYVNIGHVKSNLGANKEAVAMYEKARAIYRRLGDKSLEAQMSGFIANCQA